jgi:lysophospholipase L1-like esterase
VRISSTARFRSIAAGLVASSSLLGMTACSLQPDAPSAGSTSSAAAPVPADESTYLALGDSVPFGFQAGASTEFSDASNFVGYPELVGEELGLDVVNASCPGETTESFQNVTAQSNGCQNTLRSAVGFRTAFPLHVAYESREQSQLDYALEVLAEDDDVELVTLQIGANDAFLCQQSTADRVAQTVQGNLDRILAALRQEYDGQIVVVTYYALDYADPTGVAIQLLDNGIAQVAESHGADVADGFAAFRPAAEVAGGDSTAAGLVLPKDVHPTGEGQQLLADAVLEVVGN